MARRRRQRARHDRGRCHRHAAGAERPPRDAGGERAGRSGPHQSFAGEILVSFTLPPRPKGASDAYLRMIPRTEMDIAVVGVGVSLTLKDGVCTTARVGLGAVAPTVLLVEAAAKALIGSKLDDAALNAAASACSAACRPIDDKRGTIAYRTNGCRRTVKAYRCHRRPARRRRELKTMTKLHVSTTVNGEPAEFLCEPYDTMLDALRGPLGLTGSKEGCASGDCGACSIMLDDRLVCSCLMLSAEAEGHDIRTIEGMAKGEHLHPLQQKFLEMAALQCGICTSGMLVASDALLQKNPRPSEEEVRFWLAGNLCRCTGYDKIVRAVLETAADMREQGIREFRQ